ncbi:MAG: YggS family pyridoxal phosphate-dependent enzyme [Polyangiaceae bacterium]
MPEAWSHVRENLERVRADIARASERAGLPLPRLVAVSKGQPSDAVRAAFAAGQRVFGENYVQELLGKRADLADLEGLEFHTIGPLQRNKVKDCLRACEVIQTVDRIELATEIDKRVVTTPRPPGRMPVLVQVNVGLEPQKSGVLPDAAPALVERIVALPNLRLLGLMTVPPLEQDASQNRPLFAALRVLRERLVARGLGPLPELSMGMSHDFAEAILEGATMVRVGTAIFGARAPRA